MANHTKKCVTFKVFQATFKVWCQSNTYVQDTIRPEFISEASLQVIGSPKTNSWTFLKNTAKEWTFCDDTL